VKYGVYLSRPPGGGDDASDILRLAQAAEQLGFDSVWMGDHIVWPVEFDPVPHERDVGGDTKGPVQAPVNIYEPLTTLAFLAGALKRIRLGIGVLIAPYRNPILCAKMLTMLDVLSGGRLIVGVGAGWMREEFAVLDAPPYYNRGSVTDEYVRLFIELWTKQDPQFEGKYSHVSGVRFSPKPIQKPHPPIWVGGNGAVAMRRVASYGSGWMPLNQTPAEMALKVRQLREIVEAQGRDSKEIGVSIGCKLRFSDSAGAHGADRDSLTGTTSEIIDHLRRYQEAGVDEMHLIAEGYAGVQELLDAWQRLVEEVIIKV
jgi:probable F420-dependent oxidoreductase